jgi:carboxymethylenebutenolidase
MTPPTWSDIVGAMQVGTSPAIAASPMPCVTLSVTVPPLPTRGCAPVNETRTITTSDGEMGVVVNHPDGDGPFPVVLFFHHGPGLDEGSQQVAATISEAGYYVISPDRYYRHGRFLVFDMAKRTAGGADPEAALDFRAIFAGTTDELVESDVVVVLEYLKDDPAARRAPMGCIGYCIGARSVLRTIAAHPDTFNVGIALHPSFCVTDDDDSPHKGVSTFNGYLYVGIGGEDQMFSAEANQPLADAMAPLGDRGKVEVHEGANHGFAVPGPAYQEAAASSSYEQAFAMFAKGLV